MRKLSLALGIALMSYLPSQQLFAQSQVNSPLDSIASLEAKERSACTVSLLKLIGEKEPISEYDSTLGTRYLYSHEGDVTHKGTTFDNMLISYVDSNDGLDRIAVTYYDIGFLSVDIKTFYDGVKDTINGIPEMGVDVNYGYGKSKRVARVTKNGDLSIFGKDLKEVTPKNMEWYDLAINTLFCKYKDSLNEPTYTLKEF